MRQHQNTLSHTINTIQATKDKTDKKHMHTTYISISNKHEELKQQANITQPDIITVQGTKLTTTFNSFHGIGHFSNPTLRPIRRLANLMFHHS